MNKKEFMGKLDDALTGIPTDEKTEVIRDYEDHFSIGLEKGRTEEEIAKSLGEPTSIAKSIRAEYSITRAKKEPRITNIFRAILTVTGLGLFNLIIVLVPLFIAVMLLFAAYIVAVVFIAVPFLMLVDPTCVSLPSGDTPTWIVGIGFHIFGDILLVALFYITKGFYKLILAYLRMNAKIIRGA